ncbi:MAG: hypothetical protein IJB71_01310 [Bacilli bacterium]|nr:hypothetical protein [Bacilli bacterium]
MLEFIAEYIWIIVAICSFIIFTIIGYIVDKFVVNKEKSNEIKSNDLNNSQQNNNSSMQTDSLESANMVSQETELTLAPEVESGASENVLIDNQTILTDETSTFDSSVVLAEPFDEIPDLNDESVNIDTVKNIDNI